MVKQKSVKKRVKSVIKRLIKGKTKKKVTKKVKISSKVSKKPSKTIKKVEKSNKKQVKVVKKAKKPTKSVKKSASKPKKVVKSEPVIKIKNKKTYNIPITKENITMIVSEFVGEDALAIVFYLKGKKDVSEFKIADDTEIEIHSVRNILYRLNSAGMVSYIRKKDKEKGWYISYWTFLNDRVPEHVYKLKEARLNKFLERLNKEEGNKGNFYICPNACVRMDFDSAMEANFKCMECGSLLNQQDNVRTIESLKENIKKLEKELKQFKKI